MIANGKKIHRQEERGNVLFLILIAVALFAALSYAVTQSTRSGGNDASSETNLLNSAQITQYPASVRTSIVRMTINGVGVDQLEFNPPSDFTNLSSNAVGVFHPSGGGATHVQAPGEVMANGGFGNWFFNGHFEIVNIGTSVATDAAGNEIMAFLPGISQSICTQINNRNGLSATPVITADISANYQQYMDNTYTLPASETVLGTGGVAGTNIDQFDGHPFGCFRNTAAGDFVYYHVLVER